MQDAVAHFAIRLICGMGLALCAMPRKDVAAAFFRIMLLVILGLGVLFTLAAPGEAFWRGAILSSVAFLGSVFWLLERRPAGTAAIGIVFLLALAEIVLFGGGASAAAGSGRHWLAAVSALAGAATLGTALTGMLLGHRYLTAPGMPLAPLIWLNAGLGLAAVFRFLVSATALATGFGVLGQSFDWILLALRWLAGILGPMAVCVMVQRILRYRNTQAATGVLFVAVILTFIGELSGDLLYRTLGVPF
jgi:hypothetical protein